MDTDLLHSIIQHSAFTRTLAIIACILIFYIISRLLSRWIRELADHNTLKPVRAVYIQRISNIGLTFVCLSVVALLLGLGYSEISVFLSSIFAVVGIALFAQWSILSNITASMIIFFGFPYRVGDRIKVLEKDVDVCGVVSDITLFHVIIYCDDGNKITYPNTLILQKPVLQIRQAPSKSNRKA